MKQIKLIYFAIGFTVFFSCVKNTVLTGEPTEKEAQQIIFTLGMTPDSLRSPEQKALMEKFEMILYEHCSIKNERLEVSISKKEFKTMGVPEIYYDMLKKDVENINHYLDTTTSVVLTADLIMDSFRKSGKEYNATKK